MSVESVAEREEKGRAARAAVPVELHGDWDTCADRDDPVSVLEEQNAQRIPRPVPVRHSRMRVSPFTF